MMLMPFYGGREGDMLLMTLCVIAYNEEKYLPHILDDICTQDYEHSQIEVVLVDSASTDSTKLIMQRFAKEHSDYRDVKVLDNPKRTLPCGWNVALAKYQGDAILKVDAHSRIPSDFVSKNAAVLESGEYISGGSRPNVADKDTKWQQTLLLAESSMFGSSIAPYRRAPARRYVNSMFHAAYRREVFDRVGGFNEKLVRTEDNEMHYRMRKAGFRLCFEPEIVSYQHIRGSLRGMLRQKYSNGCWIALTTGVCPQCLSVYHYVPFVFVMAALISGVLNAVLRSLAPASAASSIILLLTAVMWGAYWLLAIIMALAAALGAKPGTRNLTNVCLPVLFFMLHVSYGFGTLTGFIKLPGFMREYKNQ